MPPAFCLLRCAVLATALLAAPALAAEPAAGASSPKAAAASEATSKALEPLLAGEFALQAGRLDDAAKAYLQAAQAAQDAALAERATRIGLLAKNDAISADALALWHRLGGQPAALRAVDAMFALRQGRDAEARKHLVALVAMPGDDGWRQALGVIGVGAREPAQAAGVVESLIDGGHLPADLDAWLAFGGLAQRLERPQLAERIVEEVVRRFPGEPRVALLRASQLREAGKRDEARTALEAVADRIEKDGALRLALAGEYDRLGDLEAAADVLARGPQDEHIHALRASLLARSQNKTALRTLYDELGRGGSRPDPQRRLLLGQVAEFLELHDEALAWYRGVPGGPQRWPARLREANVLHKLKRTEEAYAAVSALQRDATAPEEVRRDAYLLEAALHAEDKRPDAEMDAFARGLAAFPDEPEVLYARALAWERRDDIPRAEADLRRVLVADPDNVAALNALGYTLADRTTRYREALELIDRARAAEPDNAAIIDSYGWVLYRLGRLDDALVELRRAFTLQKDAEIAAHLGEVLWVSGKRDEARRYFDQARELDPDNRALQRALEKVGA
ncbi:tetratricopeptide repeat protein [Cognatilysobacter bugurensis]|uniref:Membrane protein n=1 Tax=Cognatilysobacter bugurensis TaxID=543356 RepID=A0A918T3K3_9GAMM|nr:tetratricopeptide repeat protein [Lysobacter bugurensis]GHA89519.1 membrane protein [Lysobacter bugurensis]